MMRNTRVTMKPVLFAGLAAASLLTAGCAGGAGSGNEDVAYVARDVETLYAEAKRRLDRGNTQLAAALFDEVERQHPYSPWARRAQLMSAFSYYVAQDYNQAIQSAQRFLSIHPGNRDAPYAYYLIALSYYEQHAADFEGRRFSEVQKRISAGLLAQKLDRELAAYLKDLRSRAEIRVNDISERDGGFR